MAEEENKEEMYRQHRRIVDKFRDADQKMNEWLDGMGIPPVEKFEDILAKSGNLDTYVGKGLLPEDEKQNQ